MAKRLTQKEKDEIVKYFIDGKSIDQLSKDYKCTKLTISRNLKRTLGEKKYKELNSKKISSDQIFEDRKENIINENNKFSNKKHIENTEKEFFNFTPFLEIAPLNCDIDNTPRKDLSSQNISEIELPKIVYMIVDKNIELEIKYLKDYPDWQYLSEEELNRKTIQIFTDLKNAKRICNKDQKVIKVPNTNVFKIVSPILLSRGISRIIISDELIAL